MLKCPKCGKEMIMKGEDNIDKWLICENCELTFCITEIAERCAKAEAELEKAKEDSLKSIEYSEQLSNKLFKAEADNKELRAELQAIKDRIDCPVCKEKTMEYKGNGIFICQGINCSKIINVLAVYEMLNQFRRGGE